MHVPICVPSVEQIVSPAVVHEALEPVGAEGACCAGEAAGATEGEAATVLDGAAGVLELSVGAAAADGTTAATFSCTFRLGRAADGTAATADDEGCTAGDALGVLSLWLEPPGTVQPIGVHCMPCTLPLPSGAMVLNRSGGTSRSPNAQPSHVSVTVAVVSVPVAGLWMEICLLQIGLSFGLA